MGKKGKYMQSQQPQTEQTTEEVSTPDAIETTAASDQTTGDNPVTEDQAPTAIDTGTPDAPAQESQQPEVAQSEPAVTAIAAPVVQPEIKVVVPQEQTTTPVVKSTQAQSFMGRVEALKQNGTVTEKGLISRLENYVSKMAPKNQMNEKDGSALQMSLYKTMLNVIEKSDSEFVSCFNILLGFFKEYEKQAFGDLYVNRFMENGTLKGQEAITFQKLVNMLKVTCETSTRQAALKQMSLEKALEKGLSEQGRQRIIAFYRG